MTTIFFFYGLSFFIMGLAILVYPKRHSMFALAPQLNWVAGFGLVHGINEGLVMRTTTSSESVMSVPVSLPYWGV